MLCVNVVYVMAAAAACGGVSSVTWPMAYLFRAAVGVAYRYPNVCKQCSWRCQRIRNLNGVIIANSASTVSYLSKRMCNML